MEMLIGVFLIVFITVIAVGEAARANRKARMQSAAGKTLQAYLNHDAERVRIARYQTALLTNENYWETEGATNV